jgi:hypothetical protein
MMRWLLRSASLIVTLALIFALAGQENSLGVQLVVFFGAFAVTMVSLLSAWQWEKVGGIATMAGAAVLGLAAMWQAYAEMIAPSSGKGEMMLSGIWKIPYPGAEFVVLNGILWSLPFLILGWLFARMGLHDSR